MITTTYIKLNKSVTCGPYARNSRSLGIVKENGAFGKWLGCSQSKCIVRL
jgi:hypothetical protein